MKRLSIDFVKQFVEIDSGSGCKLLSEEYINCSAQLAFQCKCGNIFNTAFGDFKTHNKRQCNDCGKKISSNKTRLSYSYINDFISKMGYAMVDKTYTNNETPITFKDEYNYHYYMSFTCIERLEGKPYPFRGNNPYAIANIKIWLKLNEKNFTLLDTNFKGYHSNMLWQCLNDDCKEKFTLSWYYVHTAGIECPYCAGKRIGISNCLATKNPELAKEWHPTKNGDNTPYNIGYKSTKKVWWQCNKNPKHEWYTPVYSRNRGCGCPYCSGYYPSEDYNLLVNNPDLCEEWNYKKNKNQPNQYAPFTPQRVWWVCKKCGNEWQAPIADRNGCKSTGCPKCNRSKGETRIAEYLKLNNIIYKAQKNYKGLIGLGGGLLSYDFYLPSYNALIEFQGEQHKRFVKGMHASKKAFEKQVEHDKLKRNYAQNNNIKLLEIWYYDFDNIETILTDYLNQCNTEEGGIII